MKTPTRSEVQKARANTDRLEGYTQLRGDCCICGHTYRDGPGPVSHGYCPDCDKIEPGEPVYAWRVERLAEDMAVAWGRFMLSKPIRPQQCAETKHEWDRARARFRWALGAMVEQYEAKERD